MYKPARMGNGIEIWGVPSFSKIQIETNKWLTFWDDGWCGWQHPGLPGEKSPLKIPKEYGSMENLIPTS
jgi:DNA polymerase-1